MEIKEQCRSRGYFLHPDTERELKKTNDPEEVIKKVFDSLPNDETVILPTHIQEVDKKTEKKLETTNSIENEIQFGDFEIKKDITNKSNCSGELNDFIDYFNDRFDKISQEIRKRNGMNKTRPIESLKNFSGETSVIGIVNEIRETTKGHQLIKLEDKSGELPALALKNNEKILRESEKVLEDEVIGLKGKIGNESDLLIIEKIFWPDIPIKNEPNKSNTEKFAAFISDIHFGSNTFLQEPWNNFVKWINGKVNNSSHKKLAKKVKYLVVAGDIVEGVGVYPGQKEVLSIESIGKQYEKAAYELSKLRDDIKIFLSPGNHDAVRQAEPQPALCEEIKEPFNGIENIEFIGNPCLLNLSGVKTLIYHGRSLDDLVAELPNKRYEEPAELMKEYIKRRHLAPCFGKNTPLAPEKKDYLFVDNPDIIHSGHIHTMGVDKYRGINLFNTGTWQGQTKFQRKKGIEPTPGRVVLFNLKKHEPKILKFYK